LAGKTIFALHFGPNDGVTDWDGTNSGMRDNGQQDIEYGANFQMKDATTPLTLLNRTSVMA